mmetsp:Transcript_59717/g.133323  ORF Transcript_59717/g.133323 Transcript_59717/m.133323 type:complete len:529 (-) Transcript_59717:5-1591(-)
MGQHGQRKRAEALQAPQAPQAPQPDPAAEAKPEPKERPSHGHLRSGQGERKTPLRWQRRWASWQENGIEVGACIWADMKADVDTSLLPKIKKDMEERLSLSLGKDAVVAILDDDFPKLKRLFVCLLAKAEECTELRSVWKSCKLLDGGAEVSWRDTIDTASRNHIPNLKKCWNPKKHPVDSMSLALPARWAFQKGKLPGSPPVACAAGSHWHSFAQVFGDVAEAALSWKEGNAATETVHLVVRFTSTSGPRAAYKHLTGRCLCNPLSSKDGARDVCLVRLAYGFYAGLLERVREEKSKAWIDKVAAFPERPMAAPEGPIFELCPLQPSTPATPKLRLSPWGPARMLIGRSSHCQLQIFSEGVSNEHVELVMMVPWGQVNPSELSVHVMDKSKNGSYVNGHRLVRDAVLQLKDGDVLRLADVPSYVLRRFTSIHDADGSPPPVVDSLHSEAEFQVPACPHFIKDIRKKEKEANEAKHGPWKEVPRVPPAIDEVPGVHPPTDEDVDLEQALGSLESALEDRRRRKHRRKE